MAEVFSVDECVIKRVGSASGDTTETSIDAYMEGVHVDLSRELQPRVDTSGVVQQRVPMSKGAVLSVDTMYASAPFVFDGNDIKLYFANALGTETRTLSKAYWDGQGWEASNGGAVAYHVQFIGNDFS